MYCIPCVQPLKQTVASKTMHVAVPPSGVASAVTPFPSPTSGKKYAWLYEVMSVMLRVSSYRSSQERKCFKTQRAPSANCNLACSIGYSFADKSVIFACSPASIQFKLNNSLASRLYDKCLNVYLFALNSAPNWVVYQLHRRRGNSTGMEF